MQAKVSIRHFRRSRFIRFTDMFLGSDTKKEVRAEWSSLLQTFHRNKFDVVMSFEKVASGGSHMDDVSDQFTEMFDRMEDWCEANCSGFWTVWDNEDEIDDNLEYLDLRASVMFEYEEDLMRFIRDCAVIQKLTYV